MTACPCAGIIDGTERVLLHAFGPSPRLRLEPAIMAVKHPIKLCECGCGLPAPISKVTRTWLGHIAGHPVRFIRGHSGRKVSRTWKPIDGHSDGQGYVKDAKTRVRLHRVIASTALGRQLQSRHVVHHIDDDGENNAATNLVILENHSEHAGLHYRRKVLRAGGDPFRDCLCTFCHKTLPRDECYYLKSGRSWRCRPCDRERSRAYRRRRHTA